jgi:hypothetical protein
MRGINTPYKFHIKTGDIPSKEVIIQRMTESGRFFGVSEVRDMFYDHYAEVIAGKKLTGPGLATIWETEATCRG